MLGVSEGIIAVNRSRVQLSTLLALNLTPTTTLDAGSYAPLHPMCYLEINHQLSIVQADNSRSPPTHVRREAVTGAQLIIDLGLNLHRRLTDNLIAPFLGFSLPASPALAVSNWNSN